MLTDEQKKVFDGCSWTMAFHLSAEDGNTRADRCDSLGLCRSVFTPKIYPNDQARKAGYYSGYEKPEVTFGLDGDDRRFTSLAEVADAILNRQQDKKQ